MALHFAATPFDSLERDVKERVARALVRRVVKKGTHLYRSGDAHAGLFWLRSGVTLSYNRRPDRGYEFAAPVYWGLWGAPSILTKTHNSSMEARSQCVVDWLSPEATARLMENPAFVKLVAKWTADDYSMLLRLFSAISVTRSEDRLMGFLTNVYRAGRANPELPATDGPSDLPWPFTTVELAAFLSISRPHLSTLIGRLNQEGRLRLSGKRLDVPLDAPSHHAVSPHRHAGLGV
ncbi:MAG: Crp/Fnr family transcriptional regulator [Phyllobacteriaceae bacterium]|jgi:CRP-like cAMP-binding protein|nr:Crp/Fnr family transcriptional regulator [Phyllobacteriaceae bacterium]